MSRLAAILLLAAACLAEAGDSLRYSPATAGDAGAGAPGILLAVENGLKPWPSGHGETPPPLGSLVSLVASGPNTTADRPRRSLVVHLLRDDVRFADAHASDYLRHPGAAGAANYIYARYKRLGDDALDEAFFPTTYREGGGRADFLEGYCSTVPPLCGD